MAVPDRIKGYLVKEGEVLNPTGRVKGTKNARTVVREFMDVQSEKLPDGYRVSRFQFLLWSVYERSLDSNKQVEYRKGEVNQAVSELKVATANLELWDAQYKETKEAYERNKHKESKIKNEFKEVFEDATIEYNKATVRVEKLKQALRSRNRELEDIIRVNQDQNGKVFEAFQKASGQYLEKQEVKQISDQPLHITTNKADLQRAIEVINDEL